MASDNEASCASDPNFAVICSFLECFGKSCGIICPDMARLQEMLENTQEVPQQLIDLHIKLLRKIRKTVSPEKWERALVKFCHSYANQDGWELERFGYKKARIAVKLRLLKVLLETQFDLNQKFKNEVNKLAANELRVEPLGRDKTGLAYWCQLDEECNIRVYREDLDEENWELVAKDREGVVTLINTLSNGEAGDIPINEDSNSLEISEKPIIDTGQVTTSPSLEDEVVQENGIHAEGSNEKNQEKSEVENIADEQEQENVNSVTNDDEEDIDDEEDESNDENSKELTEEEEEEEEEEEQEEEEEDEDEDEDEPEEKLSSCSADSPKAQVLSEEIHAEPQTSMKMSNGQVNKSAEKEEKEIVPPKETSSSKTPVKKQVEDIKVEEPIQISSTKIESEESMPVKSIETPVITSPLKLVNIAELKPGYEDKPVLGMSTTSGSLSITKKHVEDSTESVLKSLEKLSGKNNLIFSTSDMSVGKVSVKPIDQLAANLVRIQSEKLEKPNPAKSLEKIAENLARTGSVVGGAINDEDDRLPQDFCARSQIDKGNPLRGHRGIDLSTSPRGWESVAEQNKPMDFSGIDLSSRKFNKTVDLPSPGYRAQDFQHKEMDLSTKKVNKPPEIANMPYDARTVMMRNHAMVADLSKRQMSFSPYEMTASPYHNAGRIPTKDEQRLPNYMMLPDLSKITALRMNAASMKRPIEGEDPQQEMLKRIRADVIPIRGSVDKRPMMTNSWRDEVGEAIEEPVMIVQGEGSGSDCDAVNPGLGEAVEEPVIFFYGEGAGQDCETGNPSDDASTDNKESNESKPEVNSPSPSLPQNKVITDDSLVKELPAELSSIAATKSTVKLNRNFPQSTVNLKDNCQIVGSTQEKPKFKPTLGVQIIPKSATGPLKRLSRWDVGKPVEKPECDSSIISNEEENISPKKSMHSHECHNAQQNEANVNEGVCEKRITSECPHNAVKVSDADTVNTETALAEGKNDKSRDSDLKTQSDDSLGEAPSATAQDSIQCDSSISLCQADTSEGIVKPRIEPISKDHAISDENCKETCNSEPIQSDDQGVTTLGTENECKLAPPSPPRFFFGPNCISYTSKTEELKANFDDVVSTSVHHKHESLQYECVSSSKSAEDVNMCKADEFDVSRTNNNSLKVNTFTSESKDVYCDEKSQNDAEKAEGPSNIWDQSTSPNVQDHKIEEQGSDSMKTKPDHPDLKSELNADEDFQSDNMQDHITSSENIKIDDVPCTEEEPPDITSRSCNTDDLGSSLKEASVVERDESQAVAPSPTESSLPTETSAELESATSSIPASSENIYSDVKENLNDTPIAQVNSSENEGECSVVESNTDNVETATEKIDRSSALSSVSEDPNASTLLAVLTTVLEDTETKAPMDVAEDEDEKDDDDSQDVETIDAQDEKEESDKCESLKDTNEQEHIEQGQLENITNQETAEGSSNIDSRSICTDNDENNDALDVDEDLQDSKEMKDETSATSCMEDVALKTEPVLSDTPVDKSCHLIGDLTKDASVPTISSSDDVCVFDDSSQESTDEVEAKSSAGDIIKEHSVCNILSATVPDTNLRIDSPSSDSADISSAVTASDAVETIDKIDDSILVKEDSSDIVKDSDMNMHIDVKISGGNESPILSEERVVTEENLQSAETVSCNEDLMDTDHTTTIIPDNEPLEKNDDNVPKSESEFGLSSLNSNQESISDEQHRSSPSSCIDKEQETQSSNGNETEQIIDNVASTALETKEAECLPEIVESTDSIQNEANVAEPTSESNGGNVESTVSTTEVKQSLVPCYDSDSSNVSDDVFESDVKKPCSEQDNVTAAPVNSPEVEEKCILEIPKEQEINNPSEDTQPQAEAEQQVELKVETEIDETAAKEEIENDETSNEEESVLNKTINNINDNTATSINEIPLESDKSMLAESDDSSAELNDEDVKKPEIAHTSDEIDSHGVSNENNKESPTTDVAAPNNLVTPKAEDYNRSSIQPTENEFTVANEKEGENIENIEVTSLKEQSEVTEKIGVKNFNDGINLAKNEDELEPIEEKIITNLDIDSNYTKKENHEEPVPDQIPINFCDKEKEELSTSEDEKSNFDTKLNEKCDIINISNTDKVQPVLDIALLKTDNMSPEVEKIDCNQIKSEDSKPVESISHMNSTGKPDNLNIADKCHNHEEPFTMLKKISEPCLINTVTSLTGNQPEIAQLPPEKEVLSNTFLCENECKKEVNKRHSESSDILEEPPIKLTPRYTELKPFTDDKVLTDKTYTLAKQEEETLISKAEKLELPVEQPILCNTIEKEVHEKGNEPELKRFDEEPEPAVKATHEEKIEDIQTVEFEEALASDDSMGVDNESVFNTAHEDEVDPLACPEDDTDKKISNLVDDPDTAVLGIRVKTNDLVYEGWKLDSTEPPKASRKRRNSSHESNSEDGSIKQDADEIMGGKRMKLRGKRTPDKQLRKSVEESREGVLSSDDEAMKGDVDKTEEQERKDASGEQGTVHLTVLERKSRGRPRGRRRRGNRGFTKKPKHSELQAVSTPKTTSSIQPEGTPSNDSSIGMTPTAQRKRKKRKMMLGLEIGRDIEPEVQGKMPHDETPVRQSRRIAQLKIKEEADRRRIEEETLSELKDKKDTDKKKRKKQKHESEDEVVIKEIEKEKKAKKKRRKRKKKKVLSKFNEANPWQSSSGSTSDDDNDNDEEEEEEDDIESEESLLFKSDHEFSPESDLEKDQESEPLRRARTAQKAQSDVEEADDEYACQKCGKADHPEWILLCDSCDKGWHCLCLRPALMLIPEGDWFCPPCQHNLLVNKLRENLKTFDQLTKRHENEVLRKKRLAFVGISLDNVLHKNESPRTPKESKDSSEESDEESTSSSSESSSETSSSEESEPVYQLRERRCANTYKFNEYDDMINAAIQDEVEAVQGAGNQGRGKDIATIVNAEKEEAQLHFQNEESDMQEMQEEKDNSDKKSEKESDEEYKVEADDVDEEEEERKTVVKKLLSRKKHRKLNSLDISSEDDPDSDEDFKGTSSDDEEDFDDHITSSDDSSFADLKRRGKRGDPRPVRRSTRARMTRYDDEFINDDSDDSDRPKRKKSRSLWGDSDSEDSDNSWRQRKKKSRTMLTSRSRTIPKVKNKKKRKRKRIIESDNQSENDDDDEPTNEIEFGPQSEMQLQSELPESESTVHGAIDTKLDNNTNAENISGGNNEMKEIKLADNIVNMNAEIPAVPDASAVPAEPRLMDVHPKKKKEPKPKKTPGIRRKIIYGGLPDDNARQEEEETLSRRTRGRKINYQEEIASDSEEELKKALRKTGESEDEFVVNEADDVNEDGEKDSDSGDIYTPKKDAPKFKSKSPKSRRPRKSKSPGTKRKTMNDGTPKQRKKPGPKPGSKNKARKQKFGADMKLQDSHDGDVMGVMDNPMGDMEGRIDDNLSENVGLSGTVMSVSSSFTGDIPEGSLTGLGPGELADLDDEQLEQMMMEDEEYGRRQLELAAIEIAKKKKKEEREAKKLEKARLKALEILAAERERDANAPEGTDGEAPKKKKRGRRSKAEILAEQMRRDGAPNLNAANLAPTVALATGVPSNISPGAVNPALAGIMTPDAERSGESQIPMITGPDGQLFSPDGSPMKPKRRGRGKGKKTLALEAARAAEAAAKAVVDVGLIGMGTDSNPEMKINDIPNVLPTPGSSTSGSAPSTPPAGVVASQGPPPTQTSNAQSVYPPMPPNQQSSVITRMLQSQPVASSPQSFTAAAAAMGHKYFGAPNTGGQMMGGPRTGYEMQPRGRIPSPYRQPGQASIPPHFAAVRSGTPPMRMRVPGPQIYHTPHHPMDPSPSGGGPIAINSRDRSSPLGPGPAMIPPAAGSPLAKGGPTPPPPPPYVRGGPPMSRFADNPMGPRHQIPPFTNASPVNHNLQQASPPPNRPAGNFSPYHPPPPPNYHYGAYPPPPPMTTADDAAYQGSPYPAEHFSTPAENQPPIQAPPPPPQQAHPNDGGPGNKQYDEEGTGEFGGLVSYFSSQREDDLDS